MYIRFQRLFSIAGSLLTIIMITTSCQDDATSGILFISASRSGVFEVYRIVSEQPLQYESEIIGEYNEPLHLKPAQYLILSDCSSQNVTIRADKSLNLVAHTIVFTPPTEPNPDDIFSIQCERYASTESRQHLNGRFEINMLSGHNEILVGMVPFTPNPEIMANTGKAQIIEYKISSIMVEGFDQMRPGTRYFVSPQNQLVSITQNQEFGSRQFLLPGDYQLEVNGTSMLTKLAPGENQVVTPSFVKIATGDADLSLSPQIRGIPAYAEINDSHHIELNHTYPVLPSKAKVSLSDSSEEQFVSLEPNKLTTIEARSVLVRSSCSPWDWTCIGRTQIYLFIGDEQSPSAQGITDVPLFFFSDDAWVSLQGTKDIRIKIPQKHKYQEFETGFAEIIPHQKVRSTYYTDLARIETHAPNQKGQSLDLSLNSRETYLLIAGRYTLGVYVTSNKPDGDRLASQKAIKVKPYKTTEVSFASFTLDRKAAHSGTPHTTPEPTSEPKDYAIYPEQVIPNTFF